MACSCRLPMVVLLYTVIAHYMMMMMTAVAMVMMMICESYLFNSRIWNNIKRKKKSHCCPQLQPLTILYVSVIGTAQKYSGSSSRHTLGLHLINCF